jgi:hypothetical protein
MSLNDASLLESGTVSASGGTALAFESKGMLLDKNTLFVSADTDLRTRREVDCLVKYPKIQASAPNGYTQARAIVTLKVPLSLDNGAVTVNTIQISMSYDVETSDTEKDDMLTLGAQILSDSDFSGFFKNLSVV